MQKEKQKELFGKLDELKKEIISLKSELNQTNRNKEEWFKKKQDYNNQIRVLIGKIKEDKHNKDSLIKQIKEDKEIREKCNKEVKNKIGEVRELSKEKREISKKFNIKEDPSEIKKQIEQLEFKIETEGISFEKEKKLMCIIKDLKKRYNEAESISNIWSEIYQKLEDMKEKKERGKEVHRKIQQTAEESQKIYEEMCSLFKEVNELKNKEEEAFKKFVEFKIKFNERNEKLKVKLTEINQIKRELGEYAEIKRFERENKANTILKLKEQNVESKIKKREKLTTEDLLVFQKAGQ